MNLVIGSKYITSSGLVGSAAFPGANPKPVRLYSVSLKSGSTASVLSLLDGATAGGTEYVSMTGNISTGAVINFAGGLRFPDGLYAVVDGNISYAVLSFTEEF